MSLKHTLAKSFEFKQAFHLRTLYEDFLSLLNAFLWNLVGFFFLHINYIFGTVYLISFNLFILYTVLYIYIYIFFFLIYVFVQLMFLIKIS